MTRKEETRLLSDEVKCLLRWTIKRRFQKLPFPSRITLFRALTYCFFYTYPSLWAFFSRCNVSRKVSKIIFLFSSFRVKSIIFTFINCCCSNIILVCGEFYSENMKSPRGTFEIENYSSGDNFKLNDSLLCIYRFVARQNEKVVLKFNKFDIKSIAPE